MVIPQSFLCLFDSHVKEASHFGPLDHSHKKYILQYTIPFNTLSYVHFIVQLARPTFSFCYRSACPNKYRYPTKDASMLRETHVPIILLASSVIITAPSYAENTSSLERAGDIVAVAIPAIAYGSTHYMNDKEGRQQFYQSFATNLAVTYAVKSTINKERPDHSDNDSFPSGHTSLAFQGASFIHKRYGLEYSIPAYVGATFVGYSRVKAEKHDVADVFAGAALGVASSMYLTKSYNDQLLLTTNLAPDYYGLSIHYQF